MNIKKIALGILLFVIIFMSGFIIFRVPKVTKVDISKNDRLNRVKEEQVLNITTTNFASYDFIRAIAGDKVKVKFLLGPGKDSHSYEPTAQDLINIQKSDIFVYIGGEMEKWAPKVIDTLDTNKTKVFCIADYVETIEEKEVDGAEEEEEEEEIEGAFDEHIWTSPNNAIKMVMALKDLLIANDNKNTRLYEENANKYIEEIKNMQADIKDVTDNKVRSRLVFGDKMPMQYFLEEYNLTASAAFSGCSTETEPSAQTIAYLVNKVREEEIPVVLYIELNTGKVANMIANEAGNGCITMNIQTLHNVTKDDFENGETYVSLMRRNIEVLQKALY